jgi:alkanesulfonate monooxygenase SsuD/methylene tetrahydromethanopterin reductase-like flavin-dependent oxidoreductase (luciferase family)
MKFGLGPYVPEASGGGRDALLRVLEDAARAEDCAFDSVWVSEHHFSERGHCPAAFPLAAAVAVRTTGIRIGVLCELGLAHPVYVAEDAATLDHLSAGRVILGVRRSPDDGTWRGYGVPEPDRDGRFRESLDVLQRAWAPQPFSFQGRHFRIPAQLPQNEFTNRQASVSLTPKPAQLTIPLWVLAEGRDLAGLAADAGLNVLLPADSALPELRAAVDAYRQHRDPRPSDILALVRHVFVARTGAAARDLAAAALRAHYERVKHPAGLSPAAALEGALEEWGVIGDVETCIERLRRYRDELGVNYVVCHMTLPGLPAHRVAEAIDLFGKAVISEFRMVNFPPQIRARFLEGLT